MNEVLNQTRREIEDIDKQTAQLFERRMQLAKEIAVYKAQNHLPIEDLTRERDLMHKNKQYISDSEICDYYLRFFETEITLSKEYQKHCQAAMKRK